MAVSIPDKSHTNDKSNDVALDFTVYNHVYASISPILVDTISEEQVSMIYELECGCKEGSMDGQAWSVAITETCEREKWLDTLSKNVCVNLVLQEIDQVKKDILGMYFLLLNFHKAVEAGRNPLACVTMQPFISLCDLTNLEKQWDTRCCTNPSSATIIPC